MVSRVLDPCLVSGVSSMVWSLVKQKCLMKLWARIWSSEDRLPLGTNRQTLRSISRLWVVSSLGSFILAWALVKQKSSAEVVSQNMESGRGFIYLYFFSD